MFMIVIVLTGGVGFFFEFLECRIFFKFFDVVSQVGFFLLDLFFLDCACCRDGRGLIEVFGRDHELITGFVRSLVFTFIFTHIGRFAAKYRRDVHLVKALLFAVPCAGFFFSRRLVLRQQVLRGPESEASTTTEDGAAAKMGSSSAKTSARAGAGCS